MSTAIRMAMRSQVAQRRNDKLQRMYNPITIWPSKGRTWAKPFDLADLGATSFSVLRNSAHAGGLWLAGKMITTIGVSGMTFSTDRWVSGTISAAQCVFLELDRSANTVTICMATTFPDGTAAKYDYTEIHPLWSIPWSSGAIRGDVIDFREAVRVPAMA